MDFGSGSLTKQNLLTTDMICKRKFQKQFSRKKETYTLTQPKTPTFPPGAVMIQPKPTTTVVTIGII